MDKITPERDVFQANLERSAPLLAKLKAGIEHIIDGNVGPSMSGKPLRPSHPSMARRFQRRSGHEKSPAVRIRNV